MSDSYDDDSYGADASLEEKPRPEPAVAVSALRALANYCLRNNRDLRLGNPNRYAYGDCADRLLALCDAAEKQP